MNTLRVALIQQKAVANHPEENLALGLSYLRQAKQRGADIALFPELWSNAYALPFDIGPTDAGFERGRSALLATALEETSGYVQEFQACARSLGIGAVITYLSKGKHAPQNTALVIDRNGQILMSYSKVHTCDFSAEALLESGDAFKTCNFCGVQLGVMICYDREFPESARILMLKGAEIILVPNACDINPARLNQLSTRAFENMVGVAMANYPLAGWGRSCAFSPVVFDENGYADPTLLLAEEQAEVIFIAEFNLDQMRDYRKKETWGNAYRKVHAYRDLLSEEVREPFCRPPR